VNRSNVSQAAIFDAGDWRPRYWTLACVSTFHLILAATLITNAPKLPEPTVFNAVDVVTFPDGTKSTPDPQAPSDPVELTPTPADPVLPLPKIQVDPKFGPKPTDMREKAAPDPITPPLPVQPPPLEDLTPEPLPVPPPPPKPEVLTPAPQASLVPESEVVPRATPTPVPVQPPVTSTPPVQARKSAPAPTLVLPPPDPLNIRGDKLKVNQAPALKPLQTRTIPALVPTPTPVAVPSPAPGLPKTTSVAPVTAVPSPVPAPVPNKAARTLSPPPPAFTAPAPAPLAPSTGTRALPKVQVPRVMARDLRLPDAQAAAGGALPAAGGSTAPAGVTSLSPSGGGAGSAGGAGGSGGSGGFAGGAGSAGSAGGGGPPAAGSGGGGPSGVLPRRPGGARVPEAFPRSDGSLLGQMDRTFDCSRIGRDRDARCPEWNPIEGRNARGAANFEVPLPKGVIPPRYANGTNPLPVCPPGTPGNQMGLSCLPSREGPGIPKQ
jgi:uncharacterized membrane protein YgcG